MVKAKPRKPLTTAHRKVRAPKFSCIEPQRTCACGSAMVYAKQKARRIAGRKAWVSERVSLCTNGACRTQVTKRLGRAESGIMIQMDPRQRRLDVPVWKAQRQLIELETRPTAGSASVGS
jgi:hypothetical protein